MMRQLEDWIAEKMAIDLSLITAKAARSLHNDQRWIMYVDSMRPLAENLMARLQSVKLDAYELGKTQGQLRALKLLIDTNNVSDKDLEKLSADEKVLREKIDTVRNLIGNTPEELPPDYPHE